MPSINLLPQVVLQRRRVRRRLRRWTTFLSVYSGAVVSATLALVDPFASRDAAVMTPPGEQHRLAEVLAQIDALNGRMAGLLSQLKTIHAVLDRRDWGMLMEAVAGAVAEDVILERLQVMPASSAPQRLVLDIDAVSPDQAGVSRLAMQLEDLGIFDRVELLESRRRQVGGIDAVGCRLRCPLKEGL